MKTAMTCLLALALGACGSSNETTPDASVVVTPDAPPVVPDAGPQCFTNPTTHFEIINACTTSQGIDKHPVLPLLLPDGGLPQLPN
jgi:hypothetical protein